MDFASLLKNKREEMNITRVKAAELIGINPMYYGRFEKGQIVPTKKNIGRFAKFMNIEEKELLKGINKGVKND